MPMSGVTAKEPAQMVTNSVHCWIARQKTLAADETSSKKRRGLEKKHVLPGFNIQFLIYCKMYTSRYET